LKEEFGQALLITNFVRYITITTRWWLDILNLEASIGFICSSNLEAAPRLRFSLIADKRIEAVSYCT
jgi:hypothetical protein